MIPNKNPIISSNVDGRWGQPNTPLLLTKRAVAECHSIKVDIMELKTESTTMAVSMDQLCFSYHAYKRRVELSKQRAYQNFEIHS